MDRVESTGSAQIKPKWTWIRNEQGKFDWSDLCLNLPADYTFQKNASARVTEGCSPSEKPIATHEKWFTGKKIFG